MPLALQARRARHAPAIGASLPDGLRSGLCGADHRLAAARAGGARRPVQWPAITVRPCGGWSASVLHCCCLRSHDWCQDGRQTVPEWMSLGQVSFLPDLGLGAWFLWFATSGCGEGTWLRGFALPRLQRTHSALTSTVLLAIGWAGWHVPAFFYLPELYGARPADPCLVLCQFLAGAIVLRWVYNSSGGSVLAVALWHASFNYVTASPVAGGLVAAVASARW